MKRFLFLVIVAVIIFGLLAGGYSLYLKERKEYFDRHYTPQRIGGECGHDGHVYFSFKKELNVDLYSTVGSGQRVYSSSSPIPIEEAGFNGITAEKLEELKGVLQKHGVESVKVGNYENIGYFGAKIPVSTNKDGWSILLGELKGLSYIDEVSGPFMWCTF